MVVDAGGGTVDISSYIFKSSAPLSIEETSVPDCEYFNSHVPRDSVMKNCCRCHARIRHRQHARREPLRRYACTVTIVYDSVQRPDLSARFRTAERLEIRQGCSHQTHDEGIREEREASVHECAQTSLLLPNWLDGQQRRARYQEWIARVDTVSCRAVPCALSPLTASTSAMT